MARTILQPVKLLGAVLGHAAWWLGYHAHPQGERGATCRQAGEAASRHQEDA